MKKQGQIILYLVVSLLMISIISGLFLWKISKKKQEETVQVQAEELSTEEVSEEAIVLEEETVPNEETIEEETEPEEQYIVETKYDKQIIVENGIEFHMIAGDTWQGCMMVIPDASRVFIGTPRDSYTGQPGMNVPSIVERYENVIAAVNGAFFVDTNQVGNGGTPIGFVFSQGEQKYGGNGKYRLIGLDQNNQIVCGIMTGQEAIDAGVRDALTCNPILVQNGELGDLSTMGQTLRDARTAIGGREDGAFLILTMDGRMAHSIGASTQDEADVMLAFGAVAAGNLDGGGSVGLYYTGTPLEGVAGVLGTRPVPNAVCVSGE